MPSGAIRAPLAGVTAAAAVLLATGALLLASASAGPDAAQAGCGGKLRASADVVSKFPKAFARQYKRKLRLDVTLRRGKARKWRAELYTFSGYLLGKSKEQKRLRGTDRTVIKLRQALQPGAFTVVVKGKVRRCGEKEVSQVLRFRSCLNKLPIEFVDRPGGMAADYNAGGYVSVRVAPRSSWAPIRRVRSTLSSFDGVIYGRAELPRGSRRLIGEQFLDNELIRNLQPGKYSLFVEGKAPQPRSCGEVTRSTVLRFG